MARVAKTAPQPSRRLLDDYHRGMVTATDVSLRLVEETTAVPPIGFVASLPPEIVQEIRSRAATPSDTRWIRIESYCGPAPDPEVREREQQESHERWLAGLAFWREYFASNPGQHP
ncbi:MAG: hypothetical protein K2V38_15125 [Gemmataceae bacterium]|nr:hypothetical protein [Gemmataceae bacterium]